jgi:hypothetical protein
MARVDYGSCKLIDAPATPSGLNTSPVNVGTGIAFGGMTSAGHYMYYGTDLNIGTSFYTPNIQSPSGDFQIRAL